MSGLVRDLVPKLTGAVLAIAIIALATPIGAGGTAPSDSEDIRAARAISAELGGKLKAQLEAALKAGGPTAALDVCRMVAPAIAATMLGGPTLKVGRTALKVRNPENTPDAFERDVLMRFAVEAARGADLAKLEHAEIVTEDGRRFLRYMKAIPMAEVPCAACHGQAIAPDVVRRIQELYPKDEATGFTPGDLRGAFTIVRDLP